MRSSAIWVTFPMLLTACAGNGTQVPAATPEATRVASSPQAPIQISQVAAQQAPTSAPAVGKCTDAPPAPAAGVGASANPPPTGDYPDRRAIEALDNLALLTRIDYQPRGAVITLPSDDFFETGRAELTRRARSRLDEIAIALAQQYGREIEIRGFTDNLGDPKESAALSLSRATSVRDYLVSKGANAEQLRVEGLGHKHPIGDNATPGGRSNNRRIEIIVTKRRPHA